MCYLFPIRCLGTIEYRQMRLVTFWGCSSSVVTVEYTLVVLHILQFVSDNKSSKMMQRGNPAKHANPERESREPKANIARESSKRIQRSESELSE